MCRNATGTSPAALGNRIAAAVIAYGKHDGSLEDQGYADPSYTPVNEPLIVAQPGTSMHDPTLWQPLALTQAWNTPSTMRPFTPMRSCSEDATMATAALFAASIFRATLMLAA